MITFSKGNSLKGDAMELCHLQLPVTLLTHLPILAIFCFVDYAFLPNFQFNHLLLVTSFNQAVSPVRLGRARKTLWCHKPLPESMAVKVLSSPAAAIAELLVFRLWFHEWWVTGGNCSGLPEETVSCNDWAFFLAAHFCCVASKLSSQTASQNL